MQNPPYIPSTPPSENTSKSNNVFSCLTSAVESSLISLISCLTQSQTATCPVSSLSHSPWSTCGTHFDSCVSDIPCYLGITWIIIGLIVISLFVTGGEVILRFGLLTARKQPTLLSVLRAMKKPAAGAIMSEL